MKRYNKLITVITSVIMFCVMTFNNLNVKAGSFDEDAFSHGVVGYYMEDETSIPAGVHFYYKYDTGKAWYCNITDVIGLLSNKSYGLSINPQVLYTLASGFLSYATAYTGGIPISDRQVVTGYPDSVSVVGYALNGISGCKLVNPNQQDAPVTIDSQINNFIYIYIKDYIDDNYSAPDYINLIPYAKSYVKTRLPANQSYRENKISMVEGLTGWCYSFLYAKSNGSYAINTNNYIYDVDDDFAFYASNTNNYDTFCELYSLSEYKRSLNFIYLPNPTGSYSSFSLSAYASNGTNAYTNDFPCQSYNAQSNTSTSTTRGFMLYNVDSNYFYGLISEKPITLFRDVNVVTQIINNTYSPTFNYTDNFYNYDSTSNNNDNSTTINDVDNGTTNNTTIYNEQSSNYTDNSYYNSENNYYIDNSVVNETNTTIINNYYGDNGGGGGEGGGGSDDDDDDDLIWTALLKAIADFFKKLGELIATVLTGIVTIFTDILAAIAEITSNFSAITDFFGTVFGWLPDEIVTLMTLGLAMALFAAFISWFKK